jgi:hypothetical protein
MISLAATACYFPEIISSDDMIATKVADSLEEALSETQAAEINPTYTPYPTYTPAPTYTPQQYYYSFDYNMPNPQHYYDTAPKPPVRPYDQYPPKPKG